MTGTQQSMTPRPGARQLRAGGPGLCWLGPMTVGLLLVGLPALAAPTVRPRPAPRRNPLRASHVSRPVAVGSLTISPTNVKGGQSATATLTLGGPAPKGGLGVNLLSGHPATVRVPDFVTVAAGASCVTFTITTAPVTGPETDIVSAQVRGLPDIVNKISVDPAPPRTGADRGRGATAGAMP